MKKPYIIFALVVVGLVIASCGPKEKMVDCTDTSGTYICFNNEGREATYARWNFDTVETFNAFNIQGSYPAVPGTTGPWTTINIALVTSTGNYSMETGTYTYDKFITDSGVRMFTFWLKRYEGDAKDPEVKNFERDPTLPALLNITNVGGTGTLSGIFSAGVRNMADTNETGTVKYLFTDIELQ